MNNSALEMSKLKMQFGGITALADVDMSWSGSELLGIVGPNGAGKTSLLNCIVGFYQPTEGAISIFGNSVVGKKPYEIATMGVGRTFQHANLYSGMSVIDNVLAGTHCRSRGGVVAALFRPYHIRQEADSRESAEHIIDFLGLNDVRTKSVSELGYGRRKMVDLGRALATKPTLLLMDEPMAGMGLEEKEYMARYILDIHEHWGVPVALIEHDVGVIGDICDRVVVMDWGKVIADGTPAQAFQDPRVKEAYLG